MDDVDLSWPGRLWATSAGSVFVREFSSTPAAGAASGHDPATAATAVFVHGLGGESLDWADVVHELAGRLDVTEVDVTAVNVTEVDVTALEVFALDLPGFGESPPASSGNQGASVDAFVAAVAEVLRALGRGPVHLIGNSLGGAVVTRLAAEHPELVRSLTLVSPALPDLRPRLWSWQLTIALVPGIGPLIVESALRGDPERVARRVFWLCYGDPAAVTDRRRALELAGIRRRALLPHSSRIYRASLRSLVGSYLQPGRRRLWRQAALIDVPTVVIYGGRDKLVSSAMAARARRTFRRGRVVVLPAAGHLAHLEYPQQVAALLSTLLGEANGQTPDAGNGDRARDR